MFSMNRLNREQRIRTVAALVEGNSLRAAARMVGVARNTVTSLLVDLGAVCSEYQDRVMRNLPCKRLQADEIWSFCYSKQKNVPTKKQGQFGYGDVWTWTAICADTKLIPTWYVGDRGAGSASEFMQDLAPRLANRVQLTTDGHRVYLEAVDEAFGAVWTTPYWSSRGMHFTVVGRSACRVGVGPSLNRSWAQRSRPVVQAGRRAFPGDESLD